MAGDVVNIRELVNVVGFKVDEASAARVEAVMREWEARVESVGQAVGQAAGLVAEFVNETRAVAKSIGRINRSMEKLGTINVDSAILAWGSGIELIGDVSVAATAQLQGFTTQALQFVKVANRMARAMDKVGGNMVFMAANSETAATAMTVATLQAANLSEEMSRVGKESAQAAKKVLAVTNATEASKKSTEKAARATNVAKAKLAAKVITEEKSTESAKRERVSTEKSIGLWGRFGLAVEGVRSAYSIAAGAGELLVGGFVTQGREMRTSAKVAGISTASFQELAYAAKTVHFEADDLRDVFVDLSGKVKDGSDEQKAALKKLGVEVKDVATGKLKPMDEILLDIADGLAGMEDGSDKTAYASALLGEQGSRLIPVLSKGRKGLQQFGAEARELGYVIDEDALKAGEAFELNTIRLTASMTGLRNVVATIVLPAVEKLVNALLRVSRRLAPIIKKDAQVWAERLEKSMEFLTTGVDKLRAALTLAAGVMLGKYLFAMQAASAANTAWGVSALIAGAKAAAAALLPLLPFLLVGAVVALLVDDLYGFATGAESALGTFIDWVDKIEPDDNNLTKMLKNAGSLLFDITDTGKWKKLNTAIYEYYKGIALWFINFIDSIPRMIADALVGGFKLLTSWESDSAKAARTGGASGAPTAISQERMANDARVAGYRQKNENRGMLAGFFAGSYQTEDQRAIERQQLYGNRDWVKNYNLDRLPTGAGAMGSYFGAGASGATAAPTMARGGGAVFAPTLTVQQTVHALPGQSAEAVGQSSAYATMSAYQREVSAAQANFSEDN